jgi:hypothetical protein
MKDLILCEYVKCSVLYEGHGVRLTVCACYSLEIVFNVGLGTSFANMKDWKGLQEKAGEVRKLL